MRSAAWYEANSFCADGTRHEPVEIDTLLGDVIGYMCAHCYERIRQVRRGSDLYVAEFLVEKPVE